jgi:hypothetical protein
MGVRYVVLMHTADWASYGWLHQSDLTPVRTDATADVWSIPPSRGPAAERLSAVRYRIDADASGPALLPEPFDPGWHRGPFPAVASAQGMSLVQAPEGQSYARYTPWRVVRWCDLASLVAAALTSLSLAVRCRVITRVRNRPFVRTVGPGSKEKS